MKPPSALKSWIMSAIAKPPGALLSWILSILAIFWGLCSLDLESKNVAVFLLIVGGLLASINAASMFHSSDTRAKVIIAYLLVLSQIVFVFLGDRMVRSTFERCLLDVLFFLIPLSLGVLGYIMTKKWWFTPTTLLAVSPLILVWLFFRDYVRQPDPGDIRWFLPVGLIGLIVPALILSGEVILLSLSGAITKWLYRK